MSNRIEIDKNIVAIDILMLIKLVFRLGLCDEFSKFIWNMMMKMDQEEWRREGGMV